MSRLSSAQVILISAIIPMIAGQAPGFAQNSTEVPSVTIRSTTRLVLVDVVVTDKKGQPVTGLKAEDFTIEESGKKQKVTIFVPPGIENAPKPVPSPEGILSNRPENVRPAGVPTVLLLDAANSPFKDQAYARSQMLKYVMEQAQNEHPMAVFMLTDHLSVLQQFTSDPQILLAAIKGLKPQEQVLRAAQPPPESHGIAGNRPKSPVFPITAMPRDYGDSGDLFYRTSSIRSRATCAQCCTSSGT